MSGRRPGGCFYHPPWEEVRDEAKFERMGDFGRRLARLRRRVDSHLHRAGLSREKVTALAVAVLDGTLIRVGNRRYAEENDAYGLTTLTDDHVEVDGFHVRRKYGRDRGHHRDCRITFGGRGQMDRVSRVGFRPCPRVIILM